MQQLVAQEKWLRSTVDIMSVPFSMGLPAQRQSETANILCFRHPELPALEKYYLPFPPTSIPCKCFVSLPRRQAAELARQQAEVLGVGRLVKKTNIEEQAQQVESLPPEIKTQEEADLDVVMEGFQDQMIGEMVAEVEEVTNVELPKTIQQSQPEPVELPSEDVQENLANVAIPEVEEDDEEVVEMSDVEIEFRALVTELLEAGIEPSDMMDDPRWEDISERAMAIGFETWPVFLQLTAVE